MNRQGVTVRRGGVMIEPHMHTCVPVFQLDRGGAAVSQDVARSTSSGLEVGA